MKSWFKKAKKDEQVIALTSIKALSRSAQFVKKNRTEMVHLVVPGVKGFVEIPRRSFFLLKEMIEHVAEGRSVALFHSDMNLTTQEAANILGMSRPHLIKLLDNGDIPYKRMKTHRRIALKDVLKYAQMNQLKLSSASGLEEGKRTE